MISLILDGTDTSMRHAVLYGQMHSHFMELLMLLYLCVWLLVSHLYGFGLVDAEAMVVEAKKWRNVPPQHTCTKTSDRRTR